MSDNTVTVEQHIFNRFQVKPFLRNVSKLDMYVHKQTHHPDFGTVRLVKSAYETGTKRKFAVMGNSKYLIPGSYTFDRLRESLEDATNMYI